MADFIDLAKPLKLTTPGTAPIAGLVVADTAALEAIESPWPGMTVHVEADGKSYRVTELKDVSLGAFTKKAVKTYEALPDKSDLSDLSEKLDGAAQRPKKLTLIKPVNAKAVWPVVDAFPDKTFTESAKVAVCGRTEHLDRVTAWSGTAWNTLTSEGLTDTYKNLPVEIDISDLELAEGYFRYYWIDAEGNISDVLSLPFPAITEPTPFHLQAVTAPEPGYKIRLLAEAEYYALDEADPLTFYFVAGVGIVFGGVQYSSAPTESAE